MDKTEHFLFFAEDLTPPEVTLDAAESRHAISVLRIAPGDTIRLTDGKGCLATGLCRNSDRHGVSVAISGRLHPPRQAPTTHLCVGLPDRDAFETILTSIAALGITRVTPVAARFCQKKWWHDWKKSTLRCRQKMIAAIKQSRNLFLPELAAPCSTAEALTQTKGSATLLADPAGPPLRELSIPNVASVTCFVGPPGGFSDEEHQLLQHHGAQPVRIAHARLRTELAATVLCSQLIGTRL